MDFGAGLGFGKQESAQAAFSRQIDYFVDGALGSDGNDGTPGSPLRTFQEAVDRAGSNSGFNNVFLAPGNYRGVYISDNDLLKVFGQGASPSDVMIEEFGDVIRINGGSDVRLFNMAIDGFDDESSFSDANGIYANGLDYLYLNNVVSRDNIGSGLYAENVTKVKLYHSTFEDNGNHGAYLYDGNKVRSVGSDFSNNWDDGMQIEDYSRLEMIDSHAHNNGWLDVGNAFEIQSGGDGVEADYVDSIRFVGGSYNHNDRHGIDIDYANDVTLIAVEASYNDSRSDSRGVRARSIYESAVVDGGVFQENGDDGVNIVGENFADLQFGGTGGNGGGLVVNVYGGLYWNNGDDGLDVENAYEANLNGVDARFNDDDGIDVEDAGYANVYGGYSFDNGEHGIELRDNGYSKINGLASLHNGENGLDLRGGNRLNVLGGEYSNNGDHGIRAAGDFETANVEGSDGNGNGMLGRVDIKHATVLNNYDGVHILYSYLGKMVGGTYSENSNLGIEYDNVAHGIFKDIVVINNGNHGLEIAAGRFGDVDADYLGGSNYNLLEFTGGLYANNAYDGIFIATDRNRGWDRNVIEVDARHVVSRDNGYNGFRVGQFRFDEPLAEGEVFEGQSDLFLDMFGGYYGFNGEDGINLLTDAQLSVGGQRPFGGFLAASLTDVVAEFNGRNGVLGFGVIGDPRRRVGDDNGDNGYGALIDVTRGSFSFNEDNGLKFQLAAFDFEPNVEGPGGLDFNSLGSFDHVVAVQNGYNGVSFGTSVAIFEDVVSFAGTNGDEEETPLVSFNGGVYNQNGRNGIRLDSDFEFVDFPDGVGGGFFGGLAVRLENVEASLNGRNGALIRNDDPDFFRGDVDIINGVYNGNGKDGVHVRGLGDLYVDRATIIGNDEDGLHSRDNWSTDISDDSIIVNNGAQDVRID